MPKNDVGQKTEDLIKILDEIIILLEREGESHWKKWMFEAKNSLLNSDYSGIEYLLTAYGGMGSFNDLVIGQSNDKLDYLSGKAYELADGIKRNYEIKKS